MKIFNKTSLGFLFRFALILFLSFILLTALDIYLS